MNVYTCLTLSTLTATVGALAHMYTDFINAGIISTIGGIGLLIMLLMTPDDNGKNLFVRMGYLLGFTFFSGVGMGPLLQNVIMIDPSIVITALASTVLIFVSFSLCALFSERGKWLYLGGILMSYINVMLMLSLANLFFGFTFLYQAQLYLGLGAMCAFILYDTQMIVEKRRMGSTDFVTHSLDLFIDFIGIFKRLLIILAQKVNNER